MDITILAAWGEFLGGVAVIGSLLYLASQIRQGAKLLQASTSAVSNATTIATSMAPVQDPEVARIFWDGMEGRAALSEADRRRFDPLISVHFGGWNQEYQYAADGVIGQAIWDARTRWMRRALRRPGIREWWAEWRDIYGDDFVRFIDGLIREGEAAG